VFGMLRPCLKRLMPQRVDAILRQISYRTMTWLVHSLPFCRVKYENPGGEDFRRPAIVISNHQSATDVLVAFILSPEICMTVKKRVYDTPILGFACKALGHVVVEANATAQTLAACRERLAAGRSLHFFPEGTRSYDGKLQRFRRGAFELAVELRQDIIPAVLCDTRTAMPRDAFWLEPGQASVRILPRVTPENFDYTLGATALMRHCEKLVRESLEQQLAALNTPNRLRRKVERLYRYQGAYTEQFVHWKMKLDPIFPVLDRVTPRQGLILDLGCGYGLATHWLAEAGYDRTLAGIDYDGEKIRIARRSAPDNPRIRFTEGDIQTAELPACDAILLLDVLHYWVPEKQLQILKRARQALRPGGRLILRDGARAENAAHDRVHRWEVFATKLGLNRTRERLHFLTLAELESLLQRAGFARPEIIREAGRDSNVLLLAGPAEER
ncbi:MAG TPA: 1-acyl-sn-glycerol-3-phosphate acyltransferase, partial [Verrucomicrobiae bacterium]